MSHEYTVEFRLHGDTLVPAEISALLGLQASTFLEKPKVRGNRIWRPFWGFNGKGWPGYQKEWDDLEDGLRFVANILQPKRDLVVELSKKFDGIWWCGHFQSSFDGGPTLSPEILNVLASFQTPVFIDNYFDDE